MDSKDLLNAATPEGAAYRENGLRNLETLLLAQKYKNKEDRNRTLAEFYRLAKRLRELDAPLFH